MLLKWRRFSRKTPNARTFQIHRINFGNAPNKLFDDTLRIWLNQQAASKQRRGDSLNDHTVIAPDVNADIHSLLDRSDNSSQVTNIIRSHLNEIEHCSVFGKAMMKCDKLRDWVAVQKIMDMMLNASSVIPSAIQFNIFMNSMARSDSPGQCVKYFKIMVDDLKIPPRIYDINVLLKSFRRQGRTKDAEWAWRSMRSRYKLDPTHYTFSEMISVYAFAHEKKKASKLFHEYLNLVDKQQVLLDQATFGSFFNVFSRSGDIEGMEMVSDLMKKHDLTSDIVCESDKMRGYYVDRQHQKSLDVCTEWTEKGNTPSMAMMQLKCCALSGLMRMTESNDEKQNIYWRIWKTIYEELPSYGLYMDYKIVETQLDGLIFLCAHQDPRIIVSEFEEMVQKGHIGYQSFDDETQQTVVDLHCFQPWTAQFVIRYVIGIKLRDTLSSDGRLRVIVGTGKHREGKGRNKAKLRDFIVKELSSWDPPVAAHSPQTNRGKLVIEKKDLEPYLQSERNYARQKLTEPSSDWYVPQD